MKFKDKPKITSLHVDASEHDQAYKRIIKKQSEKMTLEKLEQKRINSMIKYFEEGCLCVLTGKIAKATTNDQRGIDYYMKNCTCTRHPESSSMNCKDSNL